MNKIEINQQIKIYNNLLNGLEPLVKSLKVKLNDVYKQFERAETQYTTELDFLREQADIWIDKYKNSKPRSKERFISEFVVKQLNTTILHKISEE